MMESKIKIDKREPGKKCSTCIYKNVPLGKLICSLTGKRIRHYQKACKKHSENDI